MKQNSSDLYFLACKTTYRDGETRLLNCDFYASVVCRPRRAKKSYCLPGKL